MGCLGAAQNCWSWALRVPVAVLLESVQLLTWALPRRRQLAAAGSACCACCWLQACLSVEERLSRRPCASQREFNELSGALSASAPCMEKAAGFSVIVERAGIGPQNNAEIHQSSTYLLAQLLDCQCCHGVGWLTQACIRADPATTVMAAPLQTLRSGSQGVICEGWQELPMPCQISTQWQKNACSCISGLVLPDARKVKRWKVSTSRLAFQERKSFHPAN
jgi:hypothetical protein